MPDLNDFYVFKMTSSSDCSGVGKNNNSNNSNNGNGNSGCVTTLIALAIIGWVLCLMGK